MASALDKLKKDVEEIIKVLDELIDSCEQGVRLTDRANARFTKAIGNSNMPQAKAVIQAMAELSKGNGDSLVKAVNTQNALKKWLASVDQ